MGCSGAVCSGAVSFGSRDSAPTSPLTLYLGRRAQYGGWLQPVLFALAIMPTTLTALVAANILAILFNFRTTGSFVFGVRDPRLLPRFFGVYGVVFAYNSIGLTLLEGFGVRPWLGGLVLLPLRSSYPTVETSVCVWRSHLTSISTSSASDARTWCFALSNRALLNLSRRLFSAFSAVCDEPAAYPSADLARGLHRKSRPDRAASPDDGRERPRCVDRHKAPVALHWSGLHYFGVRRRIAFIFRAPRLAHPRRCPSGFDTGRVSNRLQCSGCDLHSAAPLGMYMFPASVGHVFGLLGAHIALLAQNALVLGIYILSPYVTSASLAASGVLIFFSGLSIVGASLALHY